jgi:hypothetical protein
MPEECGLAARMPNSRGRLRRGLVGAAVIFLILASTSLGICEQQGQMQKSAKSVSRASTSLRPLISGTNSEIVRNPLAAYSNCAPLPSCTEIYVSSYGSDSNDGMGWGTAKATLADALATLPNCTTTDVKDQSYTLPCGKIEIGAGTLNVASAVTITSPLISLIGQGSASSHLVWSGAGCAITSDIASTSSVLLPGPTFQGFSIDGNGNQNSSTCGLHYTNSSHLILRDVTISNFTAPADSCLYATTGPASEERAVFEHVYLGNCTVGWALQNTDSSFGTIGYGSFDLFINVGAGQTGILSLGNGPGADLRFFFSVFHITVNNDDPSGTCISLSNYAYWSDDTGVLRCDGPSKGIQIDATSHIYFGGDFDSDGGQSVANGGHLVIQETAQDPITGNNGVIEYEEATSSNTGTGPHWDMQGQYWNGNESVVDKWDFQEVPAQNYSDLVLQHMTGPKNARFATPSLMVLASPGGYGGYNNTVSADGGGYYNNKLPAASGTLALQGANGVSAGTIMMSSGYGMHAFGSPYASPPVCTASDTTSGAPVLVKSTTTTVTANGIGSDVIAWVCAPASN